MIFNTQRRTAPPLEINMGKAPAGVAAAGDGNTVSVNDAETLQALRTLAGFACPEGIAAHGEHVYVVNWMDDCVSALDAKTGRELGRIGTGLNSRGFCAFIGAPTVP